MLESVAVNGTLHLDDELFAVPEAARDRHGALQVARLTNADLGSASPDVARGSHQLLTTVRRQVHTQEGRLLEEDDRRATTCNRHTETSHTRAERLSVEVYSLDHVRDAQLVAGEATERC